MKYKMVRWTAMCLASTMLFLSACSQTPANDSSDSAAESSEVIQSEMEEKTASDSQRETESTQAAQVAEKKTSSDVHLAKTNSDAQKKEEEDKSSVLTHYKDKDKIGVVVGVDNYVNIRMEPSTDSVSVGYATLHAGVNLVKQVNDDWYEVDVDGNVGYIASDYLITGEEAQEAALKYATKRIKVTTEVLNVRRGPRKGAALVTQIGLGNLFEVKKEVGDWVYVQLDNDVVGYVSGDYVSIEYYLDEPVYFSDYIGLSETRKTIIEEALKHYGEAYVWGGTQLGVGVDCSGFTLRIYEKAGITITRNSYTQATEGKQVSFDEMKPGDLLFFITMGGGISHVGIYLGNGLMIHAASAERGIVIDQYNYRTPEFARNLIGD